LITVNNGEHRYQSSAAEAPWVAQHIPLKSRPNASATAMFVSRLWPCWQSGIHPRGKPWSVRPPAHRRHRQHRQRSRLQHRSLLL